MAKRKLEMKRFEEVFVELLQIRNVVNRNNGCILNMQNEIKKSKDKEYKSTFRGYIKQLKAENKFLTKKFNKLFNRVKDIEMKV